MLELYQFEDCPYCAKVRVKLTELGLDWISRAAPAGSQNRQKLFELGGKGQVPFLVDSNNSVMMYESDDIIEYLEKEYSNSKLA